MRIYTTHAHGVFDCEEVGFRHDEHAETELVVCRPDHTFQRIVGFGGTFTEAAAATFAQMPSSVQDDFLLKCFGGSTDGDEGGGGNAYTLCRTQMRSCDYTLGNYACRQPFNQMRAPFSLGRDQRLLSPFIQCGLAVNPSLELFASPWSPPTFMKANGHMGSAGCLKHSYYEAWARLLVHSLQAYAAEGIRIGRMSVQSEPLVDQRRNSCLFTPEAEAEFTVNYLRPAFIAAGFSATDLFAWDYNTDSIFDRIGATFASLGSHAGQDDGARVVSEGSSTTRDAFDGVVFHWCAGDHFEQVRAVAQAYPGKELLFVEESVEGSSDRIAEMTQERSAERYAHAVIGCLNAGAGGFIDWNLLLDDRGGPNHVRNYCETPLMYDRRTRELVVNRSFSYLGHFSRFLLPGTQRFFTSRFTDDIECGGFIRPDGKRVLIVLNRRGHAVRFWVAERPCVARVEASPHSIMTLVWEADEARV